MNTSIIIVNYNTREVTKQCLDSIFKWTKDVSFEVIVVDNNSHDGSKEMLASYPNIKYVQSGGNLGFGKANNLGYKFSSGRYILLLNSDTYLLNNAIKCFVDEFDKLPPTVGCIGGWLRSPDGDINNSYGQIPNIYSAINNSFGLYLRVLGIKPMQKKEYDDTAKSKHVEYVMGADICIRREVVEKCGMFDPDFFMYYEESEMQNRYRQSGYTSMIVPTPLIVHLECVSSKVANKKYSYANRQTFFNSYMLYMKKTCSPLVYLFFRIVFLFQFPIFLASYYTLKEKLGMLALMFKPAKADKRRL